MTAPETIILITTTSTSIVAIMNAFFGRKAAEEQRKYRDETKDKLRVIHEQTNGGWAAVHQQLSVALIEIVNLKRLLAEKEKQ